jgi:multiple sugar transport system substrate-binding protein
MRKECAMGLERREILDEIVMHARAGRMNRRTFLERAIAIGLSMSAATSLLEACSSITCRPKGWSSRPNLIVWNSEQDDQGTFADLVYLFNQENQDVHVVYNNNPFKDGEQYQATVGAFLACSSEMDIISIDVIWLAEFADKQWILPLTDQVATKVYNSQYGKHKSIIDSCTYNGRLYSIPLRPDLGLLYYNKNLVSSAPQRWDELTNQALQILADNRGEVKDGYVWQGARYEGLVCNFIEVLARYGGSILNKDDPHKITINSHEAYQALTEMVKWIGSISPGGLDGISTYEEEDARVRWQNGFAVFMRNWFSAYSLVIDPVISRVHDAVGYTTIPYSNSRFKGYSCLGGWQLGVNASSQNPELCWQFIGFAIDTYPSTMRYPASQILNDPSLQAIFDYQAVLRPKLPQYADISKAIQAHVFQALYQGEKPASALKKLQSDLKSIVSSP